MHMRGTLEHWSAMMVWHHNSTAAGQGFPSCMAGDLLRYGLARLQAGDPAR